MDDVQGWQRHTVAPPGSGASLPISISSAVPGQRVSVSRLTRETWRHDRTWPVRQEGLTLNSSVDVDLGIAHRRLHSACADQLGGQGSDDGCAAACGRGTPVGFGLAARRPGSAAARGIVATPTPCTQILSRSSSKNSRLSFPRDPLQMTAEALQRRIAGRSTPSPARSQRAKASSARATPSGGRGAQLGEEAHERPTSGGLAGVSGTDCDPCANDVHSSFRHTREQIAARFHFLDRGAVHSMSQCDIFIQRSGSAAKDSAVGKLVQFYEQSGIRDMPHQSSLDGWAVSEGGVSERKELLTACETLNFYRWLCGVPSVRLDSFRQELADIALHATMKRDLRVPMSQYSAASLPKLVDQIGQLLSDDGNVVVIAGIPSAAAAVPLLFAGLPRTSTAHSGFTLTPEVMQPLCLPHRARYALQSYLPFLQLGTDTRTAQLPERQRGNSGNKVQAARAPRQRMRKMPTIGSDRLEPAGGRGIRDPRTAKPSRTNRAWGDTGGIVAFRRCMLDPHLRSVGLLRRGCRFCAWATPPLAGEPPEVVAGGPAFGEEFMDSAQHEFSRCKKKRETSSAWHELLHWRHQCDRRTGKKCSSIYSESDGTDSIAVDSPRVSMRIARGAADGDGENNDDSNSKLCLDAHARNSESEADDAGDPSNPLMVCFPPPGIVPIELMEAAFTPWTISPDPQRLAPTSACRVRVFRVHINADCSYAERVPGQEVPLSSFCVDCTDVGTPFCVIFTPAVELGVHDQFEVVLSGLAHIAQPTSLASDLRYYIQFESFKQSLLDLCPLRRRAAELCQTLCLEHLWGDVISVCPSEQPDEENSARTLYRATSSGGLLPQDTPGGGAKKSVSHHLSRYDARHPPPIGIVQHPDGDFVNGTYNVALTGGNECVLALTIPHTVRVNPILRVWVKMQARWEILRHGVFVTHAEDSARGSWSSPPEAGQRTARRLRAILRVLLPTSTGRYELHLQWGHLPLHTASCGSIHSVPTPHRHPLWLTLSPGAACGAAALVPSLLHNNLKKFGLPQKHPLAEHYGITLVCPLRYRLRIGAVYFVVHVHQNSAALETQAHALPDTPASSEHHEAHVVAHDEGHEEEEWSFAKTPKPVLMEEMQKKIREHFGHHIRSSTTGQVCVAAVFGSWQRAELLHRRVLEPAAVPPREGAEHGDHAAEEAPAQGTEVHEAVVRISDDDNSQTVQLVVFQVGAGGGAADGASLAAEGRPASGFGSRPADAELPRLACVQPPCRWTLAEFIVDGGHPLPYDEDQMAKAAPLDS